MSQTFLLCIKVEMENVGTLALAPNADFCFDVRAVPVVQLRPQLRPAVASGSL